MAVYDPDYDTYESVCVVGTGLSEEFLKTQYELLKDYEQLEVPKNLLIEDEKMDVYFEPRFVWEIKCADISVSPVYKCAYNFLALKEG